MARLKGGQGAPTQQAFHEAITRGSDGWYAACLRITRNAAAAEEAVQDALLQAWTKRTQFHGDARLETWIHRIAINCALAQLRRRRPEGTDYALETLTDEAPSPARSVAGSEIGRHIDAALADLSDFERTCFVLKHQEQWRLKEIAERLETEVGPVKQALFRGLGKLRRALGTTREAI